MPLPMVHLGIAVRLGEMKKEQPSGSFLLGSISPDAIHMRSGADRAAKRETHLQIGEDGLTERIQDFLVEQNSTQQHGRSFVAGYVAHLLTDELWITDVVRPLQKRIPTTLGESEQRKLYYQETDQIDFNLYNNKPWRASVWHHLQQTVAPELPPLLTAKEIAQWQSRTLRWFSELKEEPSIEPAYLTDELVHEFMDRAVLYVATSLDDWCSYAYL